MTSVKIMFILLDLSSEIIIIKNDFNIICTEIECPGCIKRVIFKKDKFRFVCYVLLY